MGNLNQNGKRSNPATQIENFSASKKRKNTAEKHVKVKFPKDREDLRRKILIKQIERKINPPL
jgi:hypothetical protein